MNRQLSTLWLALFSLAIIVPASNTEEPQRPRRVSTSTGIYDVSSPDDIHRFSAGEIRRLIQMEGGRRHGAGTVPHPVLVYCFEERTFRYTGGKYQNVEIRYRIHTPRTIRPGRRYPLIVHLHGVGEAGSDNTSSLVHLHEALPVMIGPEREDFFLLVTQCPQDDPFWSFRPTQDGTLDVLKAVMNQVIAENPIDRSRITVTGISSGGWGAWELLLRHPDMFAGAAPIASGAPTQLQRLATLRRTPIWAFMSRGEYQGHSESNHAAIRAINNSGGSMAIAVGHTGRRHSLENAFRWMLAQKQGSWFSPPPGVVVRNTTHSSILVPFMYIIPFAIIVFLLWGRICEQVASIYQSARAWGSRF